MAYSTRNTTEGITRKDTLPDINYFREGVSQVNPVFDSFRGNDDDETNHVYEFVNRFKVCDIAITSAGSLSPPSVTSDLWGKWRGDIVNKNILLFPDEKSFQFGYSNDFGSAWQKLSSSGPLSKMSQLAEALRSFGTIAGWNTTGYTSGKFMSRYYKAPTWTGTQPIKLSSSLKFTFRFGQAGIFSGEHEVVRPIVALAGLFVPVANGNHFSGMLPTPPAFLANMLSSMTNRGNIRYIASRVTDALRGEGNNFITAVTQLEQQLMNMQERAIRNTYAQGSRALNIRMGKMTFGPVVVGNVDWSFDFNHVDEYGFPFQGTLTFGGLESIIIPTVGQINQLFKVAEVPETRDGDFVVEGGGIHQFNTHEGRAAPQRSS